MSDPTRRIAVVASAFLAPLTVYAVLVSTEHLGLHLSFSLGYGLYWIGWCVAFPLWIVGLRRMKELFAGATREAVRPVWLASLLAIVPIVLSFLFAGPFEAERHRFPENPWLMMAIAIPMAVWNGLLEEVLWRGTYLAVFRENRFMGIVFPAIMFGAWHLGPFLVERAWDPALAATLAGGGALLGLCWNWLSYRAGSIRPAVLSHIMANIALFLSIM